jgi:cobalt-zinc-cadmium efflux system membrane fusion protein
VFFIGREISKDRSIKLLCHIEGPYQIQTPGFYFKAEKKANAKFYKTVPTESMSPLGNKSAIFVRTQNGTFKPYYIKVLREFDQKAAIEFLNEKLKSNDQVVVKGVFELLSLFVKMNENEG